MNCIELPSQDEAMEDPSEDASEQPEMEVSPPSTRNGESVKEVGSEYTPSEPVRDMELDGVEVPVPVESDDELFCFGDDVSFQSCDLNYEICFRDGPVENLGGREDSVFGVWDSLNVSHAKKEKVELRWEDLSPEDRKKFQAAKDKEIKAWLDHNTVKRVAQGTLRPEEVMRCRWILVWKPPEHPGGERRAKARLVVLGFTDPGISHIPNDAPTLSKDGRMLIVQTIASRKWELISVDVATAFLKGQGDGRNLGIQAPEELTKALKMSPTDQCQLQGGAYGRIDGPYLWYKSFRKTLEDHGFVCCPFDSCVFSLVTEGPEGKPQVRGLLGIHVDDGLGGGDSYFHEVLQRIQTVYSFGAFHKRNFVFCGVRYFQWDDGSIELDQREYVERIAPIQIPKHRRTEPSASVTEGERQEVRQLCGSLQYAAVNTRPDLAAKIGEIQSRVTRATVGEMLALNRILHEAKTHAVCLHIVPVPVKELTFCAFSDASFATNKDTSSRQGTIIFTTDGRLACNKVGIVCPVAWSSKKIPRVVRSTLSAEAVSLSASLDRLSWLRLFWEWLKDPSSNIMEPELMLQNAPKSSIVTDCKSVFDVATKTSTPTGEEYRTCLECVLIRERLKENCQLRWVSSQAQLADSLTKAMKGTLLRQCLEEGRYSLYDETAALKERSDRRNRLAWLRESTKQREEKKC